MLGTVLGPKRTGVNGTKYLIPWNLHSEEDRQETKTIISNTDI